MSKRKKPEVVIVAGFRWLENNPLSAPDRERWTVEVPMIFVHVANYGQADPRGGYFKGWRVVCGAPEKEEHPSRDAAMEAAREVIKREVGHKRARVAAEIERGKLMLQIAREAGLEV